LRKVCLSRKSLSEPRLVIPTRLPLRSSTRLISGRTKSLVATAATVCATLTKSAPLRSAIIIVVRVTGEAKMLPPNIAAEVCPEPRSKIS